MPTSDVPLANTAEQLRASAAVGERIHLAGTVARCGDGYSGRYRQAWLVIRTPAGLVRVTASPKSRLGTLDVGATVELDARLTGLVDLIDGVYFAERARLIDAAGPPG